MSKRSRLSRWQDLKRGFVDIGRYRYILYKIDMETWRNRVCPICKISFTEEPNYYFSSYAIHTSCTDKPEYEIWLIEQYKEAEEYDNWEYRG